MSFGFNKSSSLPPSLLRVSLLSPFLNIFFQDISCIGNNNLIALIINNQKKKIKFGIIRRKGRYPSSDLSPVDLTEKKKINKTLKKQTSKNNENLMTMYINDRSISPNLYPPPTHPAHHSYETAHFSFQNLVRASKRLPLPALLSVLSYHSYHFSVAFMIYFPPPLHLP